jgi:glycosyltransferase involved in cell wall biosynthesis
MVTKEPLVSIITPSFNRIRYLEACLQSVLHQSYTNVEHVIVDGASTDGTVELLTRYQAKYSNRINLISEPDKNPNDAWNKGLKIAKGQIFGWLGTDDTYELDAIQTVVNFFNANPDAYFVFGDCNVINEKGEVIGQYETKDFDLNEIINDSCHNATPSSFYRREVIEKVGWFDTDIANADVDYWIRAGKLFSMFRIKKVLANFRAHLDKCELSTMPARMYTRDDFIMSRRHGGGLFSPRARRYYLLTITDGIRWVLLPVYYHFLKKVVDFLRPVFGFSYPFFMRTLDKLTIKR